MVVEKQINGDNAVFGSGNDVHVAACPNVNIQLKKRGREIYMYSKTTCELIIKHPLKITIYKF